MEQGGISCVAALANGTESLRAAGTDPVELELPLVFEDLHTARQIILGREGRAAFVNEHRYSADLYESFRAIVQSRDGVTAADCGAAYVLVAQVDVGLRLPASQPGREATLLEPGRRRMITS